MVLSWSQSLRESRHNPCLMKPVSVLALVILCLLSLLTLLLQIPTFVLGLLLAPVLQRTYWFVEFLYPTNIGRSLHFFLLKLNSKSKKLADAGGGVKSHSRSIEQRVEVVKGRVYIHPIPQLLDNVGYLVVCCPPDQGGSDEQTAVAFVVDCGDANAVIAQLKSIGDIHYPGHTVELQSLLCTHKHHDHTAGNGDLLAAKQFKKTLKSVYGGAVERVPYCNQKVENGAILKLPQVDGNDMNQFVEVEAIAVPGHTRGSVAYALRPKKGMEKSAYIFTGDTMFSAGSGMPFEADAQSSSDTNTSRKRGNSPIKASAGSNAIERCFAEILVRSLQSETQVLGTTMTSNILVFPGHEYTSDLLNRQFAAPSTFDESCQWSKLTPSEFFEIASQYYVSMHRRNLPKNGKLLTVPSTMTRELAINPHFRTMKRRGQQVINAVRLWHNHFASEKITHDDDGNTQLNGGSTLKIRRTYSGRAAPVPPGEFSSLTGASKKTPSTSSSWNQIADEFNRPVFTTLYASDLESVIEDLQMNRINPKKAAQRLAKMKENMETPAIGRRPIPGTLPAEKNIYLGVLGLAILGSPPNALTISDSRMMKLPAPVDYSDHLLVNKSRLVAVLNGLGLIPDSSKGRDLLSMIDFLWKEAHAYDEVDESDNLNAKPSGKKNYKAMANGSATDLEATEIPEDSVDDVELGVLRWTLYGVEMNQPSWFSKFCMPCGSPPGEARRSFPAHPVQKSNMRRTQGELVRHDIATCPMCRDSIGCPAANAAQSLNEDCEGSKDADLSYSQSSSENGVISSDEDPDEAGDGVELEVLGFMQRGSRNGL